MKIRIKKFKSHLDVKYGQEVYAQEVQKIYEHVQVQFVNHLWDISTLFSSMNINFKIQWTLEGDEFSLPL